MTCGRRRKINDGKGLPPHGVVGTGGFWLDVPLDDFEKADADSEILDFITPLGSYMTCTDPSDASTCPAHIQVVSFTVPTMGIASWHFDLIGNDPGGPGLGPSSHDKGLPAYP